MYVRKFEADTIEDALKDIKRELGPDAVILKTITNKGSKRCF
jgi:flagellar biosynthesis protein FlhF